LNLLDHMPTSLPARQVPDALAIEEEELREVRRQTGRDLPPVEGPPIVVEQRESIGFGVIFKAMFQMYPKRTILGLTLMGSQAFLYNAIFFTYALVLARFYGVPDDRVGYYIFPFALGNFLGPLLLGHLFDSVGRRVMIALTYGLAGIGLVVTGYAFQQEWLGATTQALAWSAIFFIASAAASSAYLTVSEVFPLEMRAIAISLFYATGTALGGFVGPPLYGAMIESGSRTALFGAYAFAAILMCVAALVTLFLGVDAERRPLEEVCTPLGCEPR
jgi:MFS family permease